MWKIIFFAVATAGLLYVSRRSLLRPRSHGFFRFFVWELMLTLVLLNVSGWFNDPLAWHQLISWILLFACVIPFVLGVQALRRRGRPDAQKRAEPELVGFERTTKLVTDGVYKYIRHPLYSSLFLLNWGIFFKDPSASGFILAICASLLLVATAKTDEAECIETFGTEYRQYMQQTRMFIPYVF